MLSFPNAKINIGLLITGKRPDGYHDLETVFYPVGVRDALELVQCSEEQSTLHISGLPLVQDKESNLVWRAYKLLQAKLPRIGPLAVYLHKIIPMGAGLGGGSADAAFMLRMLNQYFQLNLSAGHLEAFALELGSDCPFFISNRPAFAAGRGEKLEPMPLDLSAYDIQVVYPDISISTARAFAGVEPKPAAFDLRGLPDLPITAWRDQVFNDFEASLFPQYPLLRQIKDELYAGGALYASLSGSGSALYGIFERGKNAVAHIQDKISSPCTSFLSPGNKKIM